MTFRIVRHRTPVRRRERFQLLIVGGQGEVIAAGEKVVVRDDLLETIQTIRQGARIAELDDRT